MHFIMGFNKLFRHLAQIFEFCKEINSNDIKLHDIIRTELIFSVEFKENTTVLQLDI